MSKPTTDKIRLTMPLWPETGEALGLGKNATYEAAQRGDIPGLFRIGNRWLVSKAALEEFLKTGQRVSA